MEWLIAFGRQPRGCSQKPLQARPCGLFPAIHGLQHFWLQPLGTYHAINHPIALLFLLITPFNPLPQIRNTITFWGSLTNKTQNSGPLGWASVRICVLVFKGCWRPWMAGNKRTGMYLQRPFENEDVKPDKARPFQSAAMPSCWLSYPHPRAEGASYGFWVQKNRLSGGLCSMASPRGFEPLLLP